MSVMPDTPEGQLSQLLGCTIAQLDISPADLAAAERRYTDVGEHLKDGGAHIYVQGSVPLGTVVAPYRRHGEYDLDLVCRWDVLHTSITQQALKDRVGDLLGEYIDNGECVDDDVPKLGEGRRSWKLGYTRFHMDVLPAVPNSDSKTGTGIRLTDKQLRLWQKSDPLVYTAWFRRQCATQFEMERKAIAKASGSLAPVPDWQVRTPLQRAVQILKRHRDIHFADDLDDRPPSSLITTLAGYGYTGETSLLTATLQAVQRMPQFIENRNGVAWVPNPVCEENFADKWADYPLRRLKFERWRTAVEADLTGLLAERRGVAAVHGRLSQAFGADVVTKAITTLGEESRTLAERGGLRVSGAGALTTGAGLAAQPKRFFGGPSQP